ncbi:MAG: NAD+ synthase [Bacteroidales bacterium]|jgi:NAD+ synthase (glutamine-hydrolysing)|nr:NAD+ synthase [Bacteroidales bacterium]
MLIALAQINSHPGNLAGNTRKIREQIGVALKKGADLVIFPELSVTGYPPKDLLDSDIFIRRTEEAVARIVSDCRGIAAIIGTPTRNPLHSGKRLLNSALFISDGTVVKAFHKALLPTYDVFDEYRYFEPVTDFGILEWQGLRIAVTICEDLWDEQPFYHLEEPAVSLYKTSPMKMLAGKEPDLVINIAAAPFAWNRIEAREKIFTEKARKFKVPVIMVNQTGANADLIFDGASIAVNSSGTIIKRLPLFREDISLLNFSDLCTPAMAEPEPIPGKIQLIHDALVTGIRDYLAKTGQKSVIVGLSGGIDSAVCAALAVEALGPENVAGLMMPSPYSSDHSLTDAIDLALNLGIRWKKIDISKPFAEFGNVLADAFIGTQPDITEENIQARIRAIILMAWSNKFGHLVLNTSNKSEAAAGYGTLYGDMAGALAVLGDVYKTDVYRLASHINREKVIIPSNSITKPPSAELSKNQLDSDSLPPYEILDEVLMRYIEQGKDAEAITREGFDQDIVRKIISLVERTEFKRYQSPPALRISVKAFGPGRRIPLVSGFRE